jgi:hypothetical protein
MMEINDLSHSTYRHANTTGNASGLEIGTTSHRRHARKQDQNLPLRTWVADMTEPVVLHLVNKMRQPMTKLSLTAVSAKNKTIIKPHSQFRKNEEDRADYC